MRYFFFDQLQKYIILNKMLDQYATRAIMIGKSGAKIPLSLAAAKPYTIHHKDHDSTAHLHREEYEQFFVPSLARGFSSRGFSTSNARTIHNRHQGTSVHAEAELVRATKLGSSCVAPTKL